MPSVTLTIGAVPMGIAGLTHAKDGLTAFTAEGARRVAVAKTSPPRSRHYI